MDCRAGITVVLALVFSVAMTDTGPRRIARVTIEGEDMVKGTPTISGTTFG